MPIHKGKIRGESPRSSANPHCDIAFPEQKKQEKRSKTEMLSISDSSLLRRFARLLTVIWTSAAGWPVTGRFIRRTGGRLYRRNHRFGLRRLRLNRSFSLRILDDRNCIPDQFFDILQISTFIILAEGDRNPFLPRPGCPSDPVNIRFTDIRNVVIDDVGKLFNIDAAGRDVGRHQHLNLMVLKCRQRFLPGVL